MTNQNYELELNNYESKSSVDSLANLSKTTIESSVQEIAAVPQNVTAQKAELAIHVEKLNDIHKGLLGRWTMSDSNKQLVKAYQEKQKEASIILLDQRNQSFAMYAKAGLVYTQRFIEKLLEVTGSTNDAQASVYFKGIQNKLFGDLEKLNVEFFDIYESKIDDQKKRSSELQAIIENQKRKMIEKYYADYAFILDRFSEIIRTKVA